MGGDWAATAELWGKGSASYKGGSREFPPLPCGGATRRQLLMYLQAISSTGDFFTFLSDFFFYCIIEHHLYLFSHSVVSLCSPMNVAHLAPPSMEFSRQEYWSEVPLPSPKKAPSQPQMTDDVPEEFPDFEALYRILNWQLKSSLSTVTKKTC